MAGERTVPIRDVMKHCYTQFTVLARPGQIVTHGDPSPIAGTVEIYTGWIHFNVANHAPPKETFEVRSFLPIKRPGSSAPEIIRYENVVDGASGTSTQPEPAIISTTITAAPSIVADDDDEANVAAVEDASIDLAKQSLPGVAGMPKCLVLRAKLALLNVVIHAITYQVTVLTRETQGARQVVTLSSADQAPA